MKANMECSLSVRVWAPHQLYLTGSGKIRFCSLYESRVLKTSSKKDSGFHLTLACTMVKILWSIPSNCACLAPDRSFILLGA
jgi:hypothetical protein